MPVSTFMGMQTALSGLLAQQRSLNVAAHNIANANTIGYTRQSATMEASNPIVEHPVGPIGTGVNVTSYQRARDQFLDIQLRAQTMLKGYHDARQDGLKQVELTLSEPSDKGISNLLQKYWSSWQDVGNAPENLATRQALLQKGAALAGGITSLRQQLGTIDLQTQQQTTLTLDEVNGLVGEAGAIDRQIMNAIAMGDGASNDLLDKRDAVLDRLGSLVNLKTTAQPDGSVTLEIGSVTVLSGGTATPIASVAALGANLASGKLAGLRDLQTSVAGYVTAVDSFATSLRTTINTAQAAGFTLAGVATAEPFFTGTDASDLAVNSVLVADPSLVAAASAAGAPGDGGNALAIAAERGGTIDQSYTALVIGIGADVQDAVRESSNATVLVDALENRRQSVSGVSLDEEMTNIVRFQRGYQAAGRALSAMDELIEFLVNRTGKVGL
jgi:flagellar hook-associated protein 1 FlgK